MTRSNLAGYALVLVGLSTLAGCATTRRVDGGGDVLSPEERRLQTVETRMVEMSRRLDSVNYAGLDQDNVKFRDDLRALRGEVERLRFDYDNQTKRSKDQYADTDRRLQRLEAANVVATQAAQVAIAQGAIAAPAPAPVATYPAAPAAPSVSAAPVAAAPAASNGGPVVISNGGGGTPEEEGAYLATFDLLKNGKYDDAIRGFRSMLAKWPKGAYADKATFWMGDTYYFKSDYKSAQASYQGVLDNFPTSQKVPEALLKVGLCQIQQKQTDQGKATLQKVIQSYPASNAANLAKQRLESLKSAN